jgi:hypothetical protein
MAGDADEWGISRARPRRRLPARERYACGKQDVFVTISLLFLSGHSSPRANAGRAAHWMAQRAAEDARDRPNAARLSAMAAKNGSFFVRLAENALAGSFRETPRGGEKVAVTLSLAATTALSGRGAFRGDRKTARHWPQSLRAAPERGSATSSISVREIGERQMPYHPDKHELLIAAAGWARENGRQPRTDEDIAEIYRLAQAQALINEYRPFLEAEGFKVP